MALQDELKIIKQLEEEIGRTLPQINLEEVKLARVGYTLNDTKTAITGLYLYKTKISNLKLVVSLTNLETLNVSHTLITDFSQLVELSNLTELNIANTKINNLAPLTKLSYLTSLSVGSNEISDLMPLTNLSNITTLFIWGDQIKSLKPLAEMKNLTSLNISETQVNDLLPLAGLSKLTELTIWFTEINDLSPLVGLRNLTSLDISGTQVSNISPLTELSNLVSLNISGTNITDLTPLSKLNNLTLLMLTSIFYDTFPPIETPPLEIALQGPEAIRAYFRQQEAEGKDYVYEAKLLIVGEPGAGKTTLAKKLQNANYQLQTNEASTEGIEVIDWDFEIYKARKDRFQVNIWDFGGQEIYKATHQFFLTRRSLYVLLADNRQENTDFDYWLEVVNTLSAGSPLLIVLNEKGDRSRQQLAEAQLRGRFPNLKEILFCNLAHNRGLDEIVSQVQHHLQHHTYIAPQLLPADARAYPWNETDNRQLRYRYPGFMPKGILSRFIAAMHPYILDQAYV